VGWVLGLWLNRVIHQLPRDQPLTQTPRCEQCQAAVSLLAAPRWRVCPHCGETVPYDRIEWLLAAAFLLLALYFRFDSRTPVYSLYTTFLLVIAMIDLRHRYVYAVITYPAILCALVLTPLFTGVSLGGESLWRERLLATAGGVLVGVVVFTIFYVVGRLLYRGEVPIGRGDIELAVIMGAMVGLPRILSALLLGSIINGLISVILLLARRRGRRDFIPYGPGLCLATFATFFM
jgi:leader peptidase (prepilin peptidase)/N-methyltransferase